VRDIGRPLKGVVEPWYNSVERCVEFCAVVCRRTPEQDGFSLGPITIQGRVVIGCSVMEGEDEVWDVIPETVSSVQHATVADDSRNDQLAANQMEETRSLLTADLYRGVEAAGLMSKRIAPGSRGSSVPSTPHAFTPKKAAQAENDSDDDDPFSVTPKQSGLGNFALLGYSPSPSQLSGASPPCKPGATYHSYPTPLSRCILCCSSTLFGI
jgi:hypothetical protein